jgi:cytochrome c
VRRAYSAAALGGLAALGLGIFHVWSRQGEPERPPKPNASATELLARANAANGARLFRQCAACHTIDKGAPDRDGPNLYGVLGATVASNRPRYGYTDALRSIGGQWDVERMDAWLKDPQRFAPGNRMNFPGVYSSWSRADLIAYLSTQGSQALLPRPHHGAQGR